MFIISQTIPIVNGDPSVQPGYGRKAVPGYGSGYGFADGILFLFAQQFGQLRMKLRLVRRRCPAGHRGLDKVHLE